MRLDKALVERKLVSTRHRAVDMIENGWVLVNGTVIQKNAHEVLEEDTITLERPEMKWVGRGALKLLAAIEKWHPVIQNKVCIDVGASTGGFTQVLLEHGAQKVFAVDVGTAQLAPLLASDKRVVNIEKTHVKDLTPQLITQSCEVCVVDLSFISIVKALPYVMPFLVPGAVMLMLIKPQFEAGRGTLDKKGVVKSTETRAKTVEQVIKELEALGLQKLDFIQSPIKGGDGNIEYMVYAEYNTHSA
jgi:23S rRNA (cytidine1920-2'-O)/16S rRNA (cytidine1409-2'-O)-methyltransferase